MKHKNIAVRHHNIVTVVFVYRRCISCRRVAPSRLLWLRIVVPRTLSVSLPRAAVPSGRHTMAVARSESLLFRAEDSGVATSSGAEHHRPASTIRQHYYPEGGWGWVVVVCAVLVQVFAHGIHGAAGVWLQETLGRFPVGLPPAGTSGRLLEMR